MFPHIAVAWMRSLVIVMIEPRVQVLLQRGQIGIDLGGADLVEELIQHSSDEPLHKAIGARSSHLRLFVADAVEPEIELVRVGARTTIRTAIVGQDSPYLKAPTSEIWKNILV